MSHTKQQFALTSLAAALLACHGPAMATDNPEFLEYITPSSSVSIGAGHVSKDRPQFGIYDGMRDDGGYLLFDADITRRNNETGTWQSLSIQNMGTDARELRMEYLKQGNHGVTLEFSQTPREAPYTINTNLIGLGTTEQERGAAIATGALTGRDVQLGFDRKKFGLGFYKNLQAWMPGLEFRVNFTNEEKEGDRHWSRGGAAEFAVEPIDWTTRQLEATLNYTGDKLQLSGGYYGSWYENANDLVCSKTAGQTCWTTTNPFYLSLPLDNQAHQGFLSGAYRFAPSTQGTFKVAYTHATQNEHLPTQDIVGLSLAGSPSKLKGELNTTLVQLGVTSRPLAKLALVGNLRYHDLQDDTPVARFVETGGPPPTTTANNTPLSYKTISGKLEGTYTLPEGYSVTAGVDYSDQDRTVPLGRISAGLDTERYVPFRSQLDEITYRAQLRKSLSETLNGSIAYLYSDRDGSDFAAGRAANVDQIAPLHIADRERDKVRLTADWTPTNALGVQLNVEANKDDYGMTAARPHGVHEGKGNQYSLDFSYRLSENWQAIAWYSHNTNKVYQTGRGPGGTGIKDAKQKDTGNAVGVNLTGKVNPKTRLGVDLSWSKDESSITQSWDSGAVTQVPDITSKATRIKLFAQYALRKNAEVHVDLIHERWKSDDWTWIYSSGAPFQYGTATDGTTVIVDPKQRATLVGVRYIYKF